MFQNIFGTDLLTEWKIIMLNIKKLSSRSATLSTTTYTYVGFPGIDKHFTVHPNDQTDANDFLIVYYNCADKRNYIISPDYPNLQELFDKKLENISRSVLYRAIYSSGVEFIIPIFLSDTNPMSAYLQSMMGIAQKGTWLNRISDKDYSIDNNPCNVNWSALTFDELFDKALSDYVIEDDQHPV